MPRTDFNREATREKKARMLAHELGVLSFYVEDSQNLYLKIWQDDVTYPIGETCFRNVLFGPSRDIENIELPNPRNVPMRSQPDLLTGPEAYSFLLRLITGLESKREGDSHISYQFKNGWTKFKEAYPEKAAFMDTMVQQLIGDARLISSHISNGILTQNIQTAAKILSGHKGGQRAIIIGNATEDQVSPVTISLARGLSFPGKTSVSEIGVMHPDPAIRKMIISEFEKLRRVEKLDPGLMLRDISIEDMAVAIEDYDRVYCDLPMDQFPEFDREIVDIWQRRFRSDNVFAHLHGSDAKKGRSSELFAEAGKDMTGYISPEEIKIKNAEIGETNLALRAKAENLVKYLTNERMEGHSISKKALQKLDLIDLHIGKSNLANPEPFI